MNAFRIEYIIQSSNNFEYCGMDTYISRKLMIHFQNIPNYTLDKLLNILHVSKPLFTEYYKKIGYISYSDLKEEFAFTKIARMKQIIERQRMFDIEKVGGILNGLTKQRINMDKLHIVADLVHRSNRVIFYGSPTMLTKIHDFQVDMTIFGKVILTSSIRKKQIIIPNDDDLIVLCSARGRILYENNEDFVNNILCGKNNKVLFSQKKLNDVRVDVNIYSDTDDDYHEMHYLFVYYIDVISKLYYEKHVRGYK